MKSEFATQTGRFTGEQSTRLNNLICDLIGQGATVGEIARTTGVKCSVISERIYQMRLSGRIPAFQITDTYRAATLALRRSGRNMGTIRELVAALGSDAAEWLVGTVPEGSSAIEVIASIVRDAYLDETEGTK